MVGKQFTIRLIAKIGALVVVCLVLTALSQGLPQVRVGDLGIATGPVAHTPDELEALGVYRVFSLTEGEDPGDVLSVALKLQKLDAEAGKFTLLISADGRSIRKSDKSVGEALQFYVGADHNLYQIVIWKILNRHHINGYIWVQKTTQQPGSQSAVDTNRHIPAMQQSRSKSPESFTINSTVEIIGMGIQSWTSDANGVWTVRNPTGELATYHPVGLPRTQVNSVEGTVVSSGNGYFVFIPSDGVKTDWLQIRHGGGGEFVKFAQMHDINKPGPFAKDESHRNSTSRIATHNRATPVTQATVGTPTTTNEKNRAPAVPPSAIQGVHWSSTPIPESVTVAFSFSERCLRDECGDGAWGAAINRDSNGAIRSAQDGCLSMTTRHGCNTGGRYFLQCKPGDGPKWVALAIYDDQLEKLSDGEAMGYDTQAAAEQWAVSNCHRDGCHVVWSQAVDCSNSQLKACGDSQNGSAMEWTNSWVSAGRRCPFPSSCYPEERAVRMLDSGILMHSFQPGAITSHGVNETTIKFAAIGGVGLQKVGDLWIVTIRPTSSGTFPELLDSGIYQSHQFGLALDSETAAKQAYSFFEYHRCLGK
jgi:hypothetical protein